jgi:hypothetical protein
MATNNTTNTTPNNNLFGDMSNSDILFINILNTMYNDNLRIIHHLMDQNNEITSQLIDVFNNRRRQTAPLNNNNRSYTYNRNHNNSRNRNRPNQSSENGNNGNNQRRVYIDNIPYYIDDLQLFTIPTTSNTRNTSNTNNTNISNQFSRIINSFLDPVNITPTQTQIENATRNSLYGDILDPINNSCPISLESFLDTSNVTMIRHCRHIFNTSSLMSWFNSNCKCPVCRYDIRNYHPNNNNPNNNNNNNQQEEEENEGDNVHDDNQNINEQNRLNTNTTNLNNNSIETLFVEILSDLSNNNIEYTLDNTSQLFNSLFSVNRRRESRR